MRRIMKKSYVKAQLIIVMAFVLTVITVSFKVEARDLELITDDADTITLTELDEVKAALEDVSTRHSVDVAIYTEYDGTITSAMNTADDIYDYNGFGQGDDKSGLLLYVNMETRDYWITTTGYCIYAFTDAGIDYIGDEISSYMSDGDFYDAYLMFASLSDEFLTQAENGEPYDTNNLPKAPYPAALIILISIGVGLIGGLIYVLILKGKMNSVAPVNTARDYVVPGSMNITHSREFFLYRTISKVPKPKDNGGSSTHVGSSGMSHGGGGGKF